MKPLGYIVIDSTEDWEQPLGIDTSKGMPPGGVLVWTDGARAVFPDRITAQKAIRRTEHYRLAYGSNHPEAGSCEVVAVMCAGS